MMQHNHALVRYRRIGAALLAVSLLLWGTVPTLADPCTTTGTNQTCTNTTTITGGTAGITDNGTLTLTNTATGTVSGTSMGVNTSKDANVTNSGTIGGTTATGGIQAGGNVALDNASTGIINGGGAAGIQAGGDVTATNAGSITGLSYGIFNPNGNTSVANSATGSISGFVEGIIGNTVTVNNSGTITGTGANSGDAAIYANGDLTVNNYGTITGAATGLYAKGNATVTNSGTITGGNGGNGAIYAGGNASVTNSGTISGADGVDAPNGTVTVNNTSTGSISGTFNDGVIAGSLTLSNDGSITGNSFGVSTGAANITNSATGSISGFLAAISGSSDITLNNAGTITSSNGYGIQTGGNLTLTNSGSITGATGGFSGEGGTGTLTVTNTGTISSSAGAGIAAGGNLTLTNSGTIAGATLGVTAGGTLNVTNQSGGSINGIVAQVGGSTVLNAGSLSGGASGNAVTFSGTGNTFTLAPGGTVSGFVIGTGNDTFQLGGSGNASFNPGPGQYQGFGTVNKVGTSTWTLTGAQTASTPWNLDAGTLVADHGTVLNNPFVTGRTYTLNDSFGTGAITFNGGNLVLAVDGAEFGNTLNFSPIGETISAAHGVTATLAGDLAGGIVNIPGGAIVFGSAGNDGTIVYDPGGSFTGQPTVEVAAGTLTQEVGSPGLTNGLIPESTMLTIDAGAAVDFNTWSTTIGNLQGAGDLTAGPGTLTINGGNFSGIISNSGGLIKSGSDTLTLSGANTYLGDTTLSGGTLIASHATNGTYDALSTGAVTFNGGSLILGVNGTLTNQLNMQQATQTLSAAHGVTADLTGKLVVAPLGAPNNAGGALVFGSAGNDGTILLDTTVANQTINSSPTVEVAAGTLSQNGTTNTLGFLLGEATSTTIDAGATVDFNNQLGGVFNLQGAGNITAGTAQLQVEAGNFSGVISGTGGTEFGISGTSQTGPTTAQATTTLTGNNTVTGGIAIDTGATLQIGNGGTTGSIADQAVGVGGTLAFDRSDTIAFGGTIADGISTFGSNHTVLPGQLQQIGSGSLELTGANTYSGGTTVSSGTLVVGNNSALGTGAVTLAPGTTLGFAGTGNFSIANNVALSGDPIFNALTGTTQTLSGVISDNGTPGSVEVQGGGTLALTNAANSYSGGTTVAGGSTLRVDNDGELGAATSGLTLGDASSAGTLQLGGGFTWSAARGLTLGAGGGAIDTNGFDTTVSQGVGGSGALTKAGAGTLTLTGANGYTGGTTISGGTLQIGDGGTSGSIAGDVLDNGTLTFNRSDGVSLGGNLTGSGALAIASGSNTVTGNNSGFAGTTTIAGGATLGITANNQLPGSIGGSGTLNVVANTNDIATANSIDVGAFTLSGTHAFTTSGNSFTGAVTNNGDLVLNLGVDETSGTGTTFTGNGTLEFGGSHHFTFTGTGNTFTGQTIVHSGTVEVGTALPSSVTVQGGTLQLDNGSQIAGLTLNAGKLNVTGATSTATVNGAVTLGGASSTAIDLTSSSSGLLHATGPVALGGLLQLDPTTGGYTLGQTFTVANTTGALSGTFGNHQILNSFGNGLAAQLSYTGNSAVAQIVQGFLWAPGTSDFNTGANWTSGSAPGVNDMAEFDASGSGVTSITSHGNASIDQLLFDAGAPAYTITTTATSAGPASFTVGGAGIVDNSGHPPTLVATGDVADGTAASVVFNGGTSGDAILVANNAKGSIVFQGAADGSGSLVQLNGGTLNLTGVTGGSIGIGALTGDAASAVAIGNTPFTLNIGALNTNTTFSGTFGGTNLALDKIGTGTLTLGGTSSYTGATSVASGTLQTGVANAFSAASAFGIASGATLDLNNFNQTIGSLSGAGNVTLGSGTLTTGGDNTSTTFAGRISGSGGLTKTGTGTFTLGGANAYIGATTISGGTLQAGAANSFSSASTFGVASGATLALNNFSQTIGSLSGAGSVNLGTGLLTSGNDNANTTFAGVISGSGSLAKIGTGTFTLNGVNGYTGGTTIAGGELIVGDAQNPSAQINGPVTVNAGGTLRGHGTINGAVTNNGGIVQPGASIGTLTVSSFTQGPGGVLASEVSSSGVDRLNVTGTATLGGTLQLIFDPGQNTNEQFNFLTAGTVAGQFSTVDVDGLPSLLSNQIVYTVNGIQIQVAPQAALTAAVAMARTPNELAVAGAVMNSAASSSTDFGMVGSMLVGLPTRAAIDGAYDALSGVVHDALPIVALDNGLAFGTSLTAHAHAAGRGAWVQYDGASDALVGNANAPSFSSSTNGITAGFDGGSARLHGGVAVDTGHSSVSVLDASGSTGAIDRTTFAAYGSYRAGTFSLAGEAGVGSLSFGATRPIAFGGLQRTAASTANGSEVTGALQARFDGRLGALSFAPYLGVAYAQASRAAFTENGAGSIGLSVGATNLSVLRSDLGFEAGLGTGATRGTVHAAYLYDLNPVTPSFGAQFSGVGSTSALTIGGVTPARSALDVGGSIVHDVGAAELYFDIDARLSTNQSHESYDTGVRLKF